MKVMGLREVGSLEAQAMARRTLYLIVHTWPDVKGIKLNPTIMPRNYSTEERARKDAESYQASEVEEGHRYTVVKHAPTN